MEQLFDKIIQNDERYHHQLWQPGLLESIFNDISEEVKNRVEARDEIILYMLRHQVEPPIKGEITKGKIRWRGLQVLEHYPDGVFMGLLQRGKLITPDWPMIKMRQDMEKCIMLGISNMHDDFEAVKRHCSGGIWDQMKGE